MLKLIPTTSICKLYIDGYMAPRKMSANINNRIIVSSPRNLAQQHVHLFFAVGLSNNTVRAISDPLAEHLRIFCQWFKEQGNVTK